MSAIRKLYIVLVIAVFVTAMLTLGRFYFLIKYHGLFAAEPLAAIMRSFGRGLRFDLATTAVISAPFLLLVFLPVIGRLQIVVRAVLILFLPWLLWLMLYTAFDVNYFAFAQRHLTYEVIALWHDIGAIFGIGLREYLLPAAGLLVAMVAGGWLYFQLTFRPAWLWKNTGNPLAIGGIVIDCIGLILVAGLIVVTARGGFQGQPLGVRHAFVEERMELGMLSLNGIYTTLHAIGGQLGQGKWQMTRGALFTLTNKGAPLEMAAAKLFVDHADEDVLPEYPLYRKYRYTDAQRRPLNVVLIIMESWSAKFVGALGAKVSVTPRFDRRAREGLLLTSYFANGQRSAEALPVILSSMPISGYGEIPYQNRIVPVGRIFKQYGYTTLFIHGAKRTTMGFDTLLNRFGIEQTIWRHDFKGLDAGQMGTWGVHDEFVFRRADAEFRACRRPFLGIIYSLSSHTPYDIPPQFPKSFSDALPYHAFLNAMAYSDYALDQYFELARQAPYFTNTLFVITSDHTEGKTTDINLYENYHILGWFYAPGLIKPGIQDAVTSQLDIIPSIYDILRLNSWFTAWGQSVVKRVERRALLPRGDMFIWVREPYMLLTDLKFPLELYNFRADVVTSLQPNRNLPRAADEMTREFQDFLRTSYFMIFNNRLGPSPDGH